MQVGVAGGVDDNVVDREGGEDEGDAPAGIAFNGLSQYGSFGVTYSPKPIFSRK